jgi:hypothetical protein
MLASPELSGSRLHREKHCIRAITKMAGYLVVQGCRYRRKSREEITCDKVEVVLIGHQMVRHFASAP